MSEGSEIFDFGDLGGPWGPGNHSKRWGANPPTFWKGFLGPRGRTDPRNRRFPIPSKLTRHCPNPTPKGRRDTQHDTKVGRSDGPRRAKRTRPPESDAVGPTSHTDLFPVPGKRKLCRREPKYKNTNWSMHGVEAASCLRETHQGRWGASPPHLS